MNSVGDLGITTKYSEMLLKDNFIRLLKQLYFFVFLSKINY